MEIITRKEAIERGLKRYYTGKPCKHGHITERVTNNGYCVGCKKVEHLGDARKRYMQGWRESTGYYKTYYENNKERLSERKKEYRSRNIQWVRAKDREWVRLLRKTPEGKAAAMRFSMLARTPYDRDNKSTTEVLGYSISDFITHLEGQFEHGMSWDNHGDWEVDHIKPIKAFLDEGVTGPKIIHALNNLRPLWADENRSKGAKYEEHIDMEEQS